MIIGKQKQTLSGNAAESLGGKKKHCFKQRVLIVLRKGGGGGGGYVLVSCLAVVVRPFKEPRHPFFFFL